MISREQIERIVRVNLGVEAGSFERSVRHITDAMVDGVLHDALRLEDPVTLTPADRWQMIARNLAQTLQGIADWCEQLMVDAPPDGLEPEALRGAFARQCALLGLHGK
jgi:hypothetical protein